MRDPWSDEGFGGARPPSVGDVLESSAHASHFLSALDSTTRQEFADSCHLRVHLPATTIVSEGASEDRLHLLVDGAVQRRVTVQDGRDVLVDVVGPIAVLDWQAALLGRRNPYRLVAVSPTMMVEIAGRDLREAAKSIPSVGAALARDLANQLWRVESDRVLLSHLDATTRVARRLVDLGTAWGVRQDDELTIPLGITQEDLGAWAGVSRESAVKALHLLRQRELVVTGRRHIVIRDPPGLLRFVDQRGGPAPLPFPRRARRESDPGVPFDW